MGLSTYLNPESRQRICGVLPPRLLFYESFEVFLAVLMKIQVFLDVTLCYLVNGY